MGDLESVKVLEAIADRGLRDRQAVSPASTSHSLDRWASVDLSQEGSKRILAGYVVASGSQQREPIAIVNDTILAVFLAKDRDRDLLESLAAKAFVKRLETQLRCQSEHSIELT
jgi:hypothetical protein